MTFHAPPAGGLQASFTVAGDGPVTLRAIDGSDGLDGLPGFEPRPEDVDAAGTHSSDLVVVAGDDRAGLAATAAGTAAATTRARRRPRSAPPT